MKRIHFVTLGILLTTYVVIAAPADKATLNHSPLTSDQIEVYRAFLSSYRSGSKSPHFKLAKRTSALALSDKKSEEGCLKGINLDFSAHPDSVIHQFDPKTALSENITFVDTDEQGRVIKQNDPDQTIRQGTPVNPAVDRAFASGLLTLSEVVFDKTHQYAVLSFSFFCGGLCGHGATVVFQKQKGRWKQLKKDCGGWIS